MLPLMSQAGLSAGRPGRQSRTQRTRSPRIAALAKK